LLAVQLLHLGLVKAAGERIAEARDRARESAQPLAELIAIWFEALLEVRLGDAQRVEALAARMDVLVEKFGLAQGRTGAGWFHGWALARTGKPGEGARLIRDAYEENTKLGMLSGGSEVVGYAAEAQLLAGDVDAADAELAEAVPIVERLGERVYLPQLLTIEASIARARGKRAEAEAALRRAVAEAREQQAPWLELAPLRELCDSSGTKQDRDALAALIEAMPETKDTRPISKARSLRSKP
jgi:ATP/maltotriose-dependent transcriptional regulator MalT